MNTPRTFYHPNPFVSPSNIDRFLKRKSLIGAIGLLPVSVETGNQKENLNIASNYSSAKTEKKDYTKSLFRHTSSDKK